MSQKRDDIFEMYPDTEFTFADGFDGAIIGVSERFTSQGHETIVVYDKDHMLEILQNRDKMSYEEAVEYFDFNIGGAYVGEGTPGFITLI